MADAKFLTVSEFKEKVGATDIEVLKNKKTGKLFMSAGGNTYKVQADIDKSGTIKVLIPEDATIEDACLINTNGGAETQFTL